MSKTKGDISDDFLQFLFNRLNEGYTEYKRNHPDFAEFVERELEGKPEWKDHSHDPKGSSSTGGLENHCSSCGEWLDNCDMCPECGRINK